MGSQGAPLPCIMSLLLPNPNASINLPHIPMSCHPPMQRTRFHVPNLCATFYVSKRSAQCFVCDAVYPVLRCAAGSAAMLTASPCPLTPHPPPKQV